MPGKPNLSANIFAELKQRILQWQYPPGYHLTEEEIGQEFGVSRVPVREALRMLAENGLVDRAPHRGCMVKQPNLSEVHELYDVRLALELFVVERLAETGMDAEVLAGLQQSWEVKQASELPGDQDSLQWAHADATFHETLARATHNQLLFEQLRLIDERLFFTRLHDITTAERLRITCRQHLHLLDCIRKRDIAGARQAIRTNVEFGRHNVERALQEALAQAHWRTTDPKPA